MSSTLYPKDLADLVQYVQDELKLDPNDLNEAARIKRDINAIYLDEVVPFKRWLWLSGHYDVEFKPFIADGTVTVTPASATITFSHAPTLSQVNKFFAIDMFDEVYVISAHDAGSVTATLSTQFTGQLNTAATYKLWTDSVALPVDLHETVSVWHDYSRSPLDSMGLQDFRRRVSESPRLNDRPAIYSTYDYFDPTPGSEVGRYRMMKIWPAVYQNSTTLHLDYIKDASPLSLDGDEPLMKEEDRIVIVYGALARAWMRARNPEASAQNQAHYQSKLQRMAGKLEDSSDKPSIAPSSRYLSRMRNRPERASAAGPFNSGGSYTAPSYLKNPVIQGAQITDNVTVTSGKTIDGRDLSVDGGLLDDHLSSSAGRHTGAEISNAPSGNLSSSNVQAALNELQSDVDTRALNSDLTSHTGSTAAHGATGAVVGTTNTQTLTNKTLTAPALTTATIGLADGSAGSPSLSFTSDSDTGVYRVGANDVALVAGGHVGLEVKDNGTYANVGLGSAPSASSSYIALLQRSNTSVGTIVQIANPDTSASSKATLQLSTDNGSNTGEISVFTAATTTDAYAGSMTVRASDSTAHLSLIGGDLATGDIRFYVAGDYTSAGRALQVNADKTIQLMQSVASPTTPSAGVKLYSNSGVLTTKNSSGTVASLAGANTGDQTITLTGDVTGSGTGSFVTAIGSGKVTNTMLAGSIDLTAKVTNTLPIANGGTNSSSVVSAPAASAWAGWDANSNLSAANHIEGYATTATAAGTTTLTVASKYQQFFTGSTTQTVTLPVASTLVLGQQFLITNNSSGVVTVQSSGANTIQAMAANTQLVVTCILTSGTGTASWSSVYSSLGGTTTGTVAIANGGTGATTAAGAVNALVIAPTAAQTNTYSIATTDNMVLVDGTTNAFTATLPTAVGVAGKVYTVKRVDQTATHTVTLGTTSSQTIDGVTTRKLTTQYEQFTVVSDGANWQIQSHTYPHGWVSYTPTFTGCGTATNISVRWRRVGDSMQILGSWTNGTATGVNTAVSLPSNYTIDSTNISSSAYSSVGSCSMDAQGTVICPIAEGNTTVISFGFFTGSGTGGLTPQVVAVTNKNASINVQVPISGWEA